MKKSIGTYNKKSDDLRKKLLKKHVHSINYIQSDMNATVKQISSSEERKNIQSSVSKFRKTANSMFRKYNVSFRDLYRTGLVKTNWRIRNVLERHAQPVSSYKFGIRIFPGKKVWRDPDV